MLCGEGGGCAKKTGLRMGDEPDRQLGHMRRKSAFGGQALDESRCRKQMGDARSQPTRQHYGFRPLSQSNVADNRAQT